MDKMDMIIRDNDFITLANLLLKFQQINHSMNCTNYVNITGFLYD